MCDVGSMILCYLSYHLMFFRSRSKVIEMNCHHFGWLLTAVQILGLANICCTSPRPFSQTRTLQHEPNFHSTFKRYYVITLRAYRLRLSSCEIFKAGEIL